MCVAGVCLWCGMYVDVLTDQWWSVCVGGGMWVWCGIYVACGQISNRCLDVFFSCFTVFFEAGFVSVSLKFVVLSELTG